MSEYVSETRPSKCPDPRFHNSTCYIERITIVPTPDVIEQPQGTVLLNTDSLLTVPTPPDIEHCRFQRPARVLALHKDFLEEDVVEFFGEAGALAFAAAELELLFERDLAKGTLPENVQKCFE